MALKALRVSVAVALVVLLAGCVGIPTSGSVAVGQKLTVAGSGEFDYFPLGPAKGSSQEDILRGFVAAFVGSAGDYQVARQFLSTSFADKWNPRANVVVRDRTERFVSLDPDTMSYSISASATVDANGGFVENNDPVPMTLQFGFVKEGNQWRISQAQDGIVLSDATFRSIFDKHTLFFLDPTAEHLVPDLRWFPGGTAVLRVVSALLAGPSPWLQGAVRTAFPDGTKLASPTVEVQAGVALVDLSPEAVGASTAERQLMRLQLSASLANISNIRRVSISVSGAPLTIPGSTVTLPPDPQVDGRLVIGRKGEFGYLVRDAVSPIGQLSAKVAGAPTAAPPTAVSLSHGASAAAILRTSGVSLARDSDAAPALIDTRSGLVAPTIDTDNFVWSATAANPTMIRAISFSGAFVEIPTGLAPDATLVSIDVSRDGARIAMFISTASGPRLLVKSITRDGSAAQVPVSLGAAVLDATTGGNAVDATWVDNLTVATLAGTDGQSSVVLFEVGGDRTSLGQVQSATTIVGGNGEAGLRALSAAGTVLARSGNGWTDTGSAALYLATQR